MAENNNKGKPKEVKDTTFEKSAESKKRNISVSFVADDDTSTLFVGNLQQKETTKTN